MSIMLAVGISMLFAILSWICLKWECFADAASFWRTACLLLVGVLLLSGVLQWSWLALSLAICPSEHHDDIMHFLDDYLIMPHCREEIAKFDDD